MVWGYFSESGKTNLAIVGDNKDSVKYANTLEDSLLPFVNQNDNRSWILHQDNSSSHTSKLSKK